jgi:fructose-1-phosphate kinase PfkB-like protein
VPLDAYAQLMQQATLHGVPCALDTSGPALELAVASSPYLLKLNRAETEQLVGRRLLSPHEVAQALKPVVAGGVQFAVCTLGPHGAVASDGKEAWLALVPSMQVLSPIGAGDVMLAGLLDALLRGALLPDALSWASALAAASVLEYEPGSVHLPMAERLLSEITISQMESSQ